MALDHPEPPTGRECVAIDTNKRGVSEEATPLAAERYDARVVASGQGASLSWTVVEAGQGLRVTARCAARVGEHRRGTPAAREAAARSIGAFRAGHSIAKRRG